MLTKAELELVNQLKSIPLTKRILIIHELLDGLRAEGHEIEAKILTPENLFREFKARGKIIHESPNINHNRSVMGAAGETFTSFNPFTLHRDKLCHSSRS